MIPTIPHMDRSFYILKKGWRRKNITGFYKRMDVGHPYLVGPSYSPLKTSLINFDLSFSALNKDIQTSNARYHPIAPKQEKVRHDKSN